jgi:hypothetical protein
MQYPAYHERESNRKPLKNLRKVPTDAVYRRCRLSLKITGKMPVPHGFLEALPEDYQEKYLNWTLS